jgi:hypothetical protein
LIKNLLFTTLSNFLNRVLHEWGLLDHQRYQELPAALSSAAISKIFPNNAQEIATEYIAFLDKVGSETGEGWRPYTFLDARISERDGNRKEIEQRFADLMRDTIRSATYAAFRLDIW